MSLDIAIEFDRTARVIMNTDKILSLLVATP